MKKMMMNKISKKEPIYKLQLKCRKCGSIFTSETKEYWCENCVLNKPKFIIGNINVEMILIKNIVPDISQPRKEFLDIEELADNIRKHGLLEPLKLRYSEHNQDQYVVVDGERRMKALIYLGVQSVPAIILKDVGNNILLTQLIIDYHRKNLNVIERAEAINDLINSGLTKSEVCKELNISEPVVKNALKLVTLKDTTKELIIKGKLKESEYGLLYGLKNEERVAERIISEKPKTKQDIKQIMIQEQVVPYLLEEYLQEAVTFNNLCDKFKGNLVLIRKTLSQSQHDALREHSGEAIRNCDKIVSELSSIKTKALDLLNETK